MTVYLDIILLENLCMNYIILFATGIINKTKTNQIRLISSSLLGGIYAVSSFIFTLEIFSNIILKVILSIAMVYLAFNSSNIKTLIRQIIIFYLTSFAFGGCAFFLLYFVKPQDILIKNGIYIGLYPIKIAILGGIVGFITITIAFKIIKQKISNKDILYSIDLYLNDKKISVNALVDTGNLLKEPITGDPVMIVEKNSLIELLPNNILINLEDIINGDNNCLDELTKMQYVSRLRMIPFSSIGKQNGLLLGIKIDYIIIKEERESYVKDIVIGIYDKKLSKNKIYDALISLDILERSEKNESVKDIKV